MSNSNNVGGPLGWEVFTGIIRGTLDKALFIQLGDNVTFGQCPCDVYDLNYANGGQANLPTPGWSSELTIELLGWFSGTPLQFQQIIMQARPPGVEGIAPCIDTNSTARPRGYRNMCSICLSPEFVDESCEDRVFRKWINNVLQNLNAPENGAMWQPHM